MPYPTFIEARETLRTALGKAIEKGLDVQVPVDAVICIQDGIHILETEIEQLEARIEELERECR